MPLSEAKKRSRRRYFIKNCKNPIPRRRGARTLSEEVLKRLDRVLLTTDVPITAISERFGLDGKQVRQRLAELGYRAGAIDVDLDTQERMPLEVHSQN